MLYIENYCAYTRSGTLTSSSSLAVAADHSDRKVVEPSYTGLIPPMQLRRMSKPIKLGVAAAKQITAGIDSTRIKAINIGTAYGLLQDSEQFLSQLIAQKEQMLTPTSFIQSTHNTVGGAIALSLQCNAHNMTYVHKAHSVSLALLDACLMDLYPEEYIILGGVDELTDTADAVLQKVSQLQTAEGASLLLLSGEKKDANIAILKHHFEYDTASSIDAVIASLKAELALDMNDLLVLTNTAYPDAIDCFAYSGAYPTMFAFGLAYGAHILQKEQRQYALVYTTYEKYTSYALLER